AAKQSGRARVPSVEMPAPFESLVSREGALRVLFAERGGASLGEVARGDAAEAVALVGPEGGWEAEELEGARGRGWRLVTLGGRTLRAETAAVVACALVQHLFGDLN
ncbi:MAG TPA: RsmE family RNA methyltransferase, partial [Pyrinomonadaceae bacterium]|nr:RsmE family RNA methyltransferase [Pyrinomonadaceae bacterium]